MSTEPSVVTRTPTCLPSDDSRMPDASTFASGAKSRGTAVTFFQSIDEMDTEDELPRRYTTPRTLRTRTSMPSAT